MRYIIYIILIIILLNKLIFNEKFNEKFNENKYTAIIIEPREHKALLFVLENFIKNLSNEWNFIIFHGNKNYNFINNILNSSNLLKNNIHKIKLININVDNLSIQDYNNILVSKEFYNYIPTETFLIFQTDTMICPENKHLINDFIKYDYVGAPWSFGVGNGGLSLRKKSKMLEIINNNIYNNENEDIFFTHNNTRMNIPSLDDAKKFSVETIYNYNSFGVHKLWWYLDKKLINEKNNCCSGLKQLIELN